MSGYVQIPSHPRYAITREGDIKWIDNQAPVQQYMGRASIDEEPHRRVRLRNAQHHPVAHSVEDLLAETFPDYVRPEKPVEAPPVVVEPAKTRVKKYTADRDVKVSKRVYSRDNRKEWRPVPGFSRYEVSADGELWSSYRQRMMQKTNPKPGVENFHVYTDAGLKTNRSVQALVDLAFPELAKPKPVKEPKQPKRKLRPKKSWMPVPGFDQYEINKDGSLRYTKNRQNMPTVKNGEVRLTRTFSIQELLDITFSEEAA